MYILVSTDFEKLISISVCCENINSNDAKTTAAFRDVLMTKLKDRGVVLCVPPDARKSHPQATSL